MECTNIEKTDYITYTLSTILMFRTQFLMLTYEKYNLLNKKLILRWFQKLKLRKNLNRINLIYRK